MITNPGLPIEKRTVLVVDDDPALVGAINALLTAGAYAVHPAYDGVEAVEAFDTQHPDLVLLDLAMPGRDGLNVIHEIRTRSATPIIVLTGSSGPEVEGRVLEMGADDYIAKPFDANVLVSRVKAAFRRLRLAAA